MKTITFYKRKKIRSSPFKQKKLIKLTYSPPLCFDTNQKEVGMNHPNIYDKDIDLLIDIARTEYKILMVDDRAFQGNMLKTYLWLSTVLIASFIALAHMLFDKNVAFPFLHQGHPWWAFYSTGGLALFFSFIVFCMGINGLRGRNSKNFGDFKKLFLDMAAASSANDPLAFRTMLLRFLDNTVILQTEETNRTGLRLRKMSYLLLTSIFLGACSIILFAVG